MPEYSLDLEIVPVSPFSFDVEIVPASPFQFEVQVGFPGPKGDKGDPGLQGETGQSITVIPLANEAAYLALTPEQQMDPYIFYVIPE